MQQSIEHTEHRSPLATLAQVVCFAALTAAMLTALARDSLAQNPNGNAPFRDGFVLLRFADNVQAGAQIAILTAAGATEIRTLGVGALLVKVQPGRVLAAIQVLKAHHEIIYAEPDFLWTLEGATLPNDTFIGIQWAAQNTGQSVNQFSGTPGADQRTAAAWGISTGTNSVVVATLDSGIQYSHPDLLTNIWNNPGGINGCAAGTHGYNVLTATCDPMDDDTKFGGHGSHVGGILGAVGNDAAGVAGVNWTTSIMAVKWVPSDGSQGATSDLITAMDWVVKAKQAGINVRVINDSADGGAFSQALSDEIDLLGQNNILFVTAAGNEQQNTDTTPRYPCSYNRPTMICVAATNQIDNLASFSNFGATAVQLGAPGVNIFSTLRSSNYGYIDGTSMAAPQVAGTAALILSLGDQTVSNLRSMILNNVDPLPSLSGLVATGGRLNVCKALPGCENAVTASPALLAAPVTTGAIQYGAIAGASTGGWSGVPTNFTYQWYRCDSNGSNCSPITGATSQSYAVLASADQGATLAVAVTASNASGSSTAQSTPTGVVASQSSPFAITSTISDGATLKGSVQWQVTPAQAVNFVQFYVDGVLTQTQSSSPYIFNASTTGLFDSTRLSDGTHVLGIEALSTDNRTYGFSGATVTVANASPHNTALPLISGSAVQGQTLSSSTGSWTNNPTSFTYQWSTCDVNGANCAPIPGATTNTLLLTSADVGFTLRVSVTASNSSGSNTAITAQTAVVVGTVSITTGSLPNGAQEIAYSAKLAAAGGSPPYVWSIASGTLPAGLTLAASTGVISGTPTVAGTSNFSVQVKDASSQTATKALSITIISGMGGGIALVQSNAAEGTGVTSLSVPFGSNNTVGNLIIAVVRMSTSSQTVAVSDRTGNVFADAVAQTQTTDGHQIHIFYAKNILSGANTVTASFSGTNNHPWLAIYEYSGLSTTNPLDQTAKAQGSGTAVSTAATPTTSSANELVFAAAGLPSGYSGTVTAGTPYTLQLQDTGTSRSATEAAFATSSGSFAGTFTLSSSANWSAAISTFTTHAKFSTTTSLTSTPNPSFVGQAVVFTAVVSSTGGTPPNGELITFKNGATTLATAPLNGGTASLTTSSLPVGTSTITASYAGDASYSASTSAGVKQVVRKYATAVQLSSSLNPAIYGQSVTLTATVSSAGPSTPTGTVTFKNGASNLKTVTLAGGVAAMTSTGLPAGTLSLTAVYNGDAVSAKSTSPTLSQVVNQATTTTTVVSSLNPSIQGNSVTFTATVASPTVKPTGTVTFTAGTTVLATVSLSSGNASATTSTLPAGSTTVTATYNGTANIQSSSQSLTQVVN